MQNSFENEVRQRLEGMQMAPSAPVWLNVEHQIRKEKRRRRAILWIFLPLALGLGGSAYYLTAHGDHTRAGLAQSDNKAPVSNSSHPLRQPAQESPAPASGGTHTISEAENPWSASTSHVSSGQVDPQVNPEMIWASKSGSKSRHSRASQTSQGKQQTSGHPLTAVSSTANTSQQPPLMSTQGGEERFTPVDASITAPQSVPAEASPAKDPDEVAPEAKQTVSESQKAPNAMALNNPFKPVQMKKWSIGPSLGFGLSRVADKMNEESPVYATNSSVPSIQAAAYSRSTAQASTLQINSYAVTAGISVERKLNQKLSIASGIDYHYYSSIIEVGEGTTYFAGGSGLESKPAYFRTGNTISQYRNSYHFISIPVDLHYMPFSKVPVDFSAGISYQRLIASNALIYHYESRLLYANEVEMNKDLLFGRVGFEFRMPYKGQIITLGPELLASLKSVQSRDQQRLVMAGVRARFLFGR